MAFYKCVSIIMLQKVAAMGDKVAADLCFRGSKVRWLLPEKYFDFAASSTAGFCAPLYNIVMPYLRHYSAFVPKIMPKVYSFRHFVSNKKSNTPILNTPSLL